MAVQERRESAALQTLRVVRLAFRGYPSLIHADADERVEVDRIIMDELVRGVFRPEAVTYLQRVIARRQDAGCDAVVRGCTEIRLLRNDSNPPLPTLDSTRLLAPSRYGTRWGSKEFRSASRLS